jgi:monothiol glutaredoxin
MTDVRDRIDAIVKKDDIVLFMKGTPLFPQCGFSSRAIAILDHLAVKYETVDVLQDGEIRQGIKDYSDWPTVPQLYVKVSSSSCSKRSRSREPEAALWHRAKIKGRAARPESAPGPAP